MLASVSLPEGFAAACFVLGAAGMVLTAWLAPRRWSAASVMQWTGFLLLLATAISAFGDSGPLDSGSAGGLLSGALAAITAGCVLAVRELRVRDRLAQQSVRDVETARRDSERLGASAARLEEENRELRRKLRHGDDGASGAGELLEAALVRQRKTAETATQQAKRHRAVFDDAVEGMAILERETLRLVEVNGSLRAMTGLDARELAQRSLGELLEAGPQRPGRADLQRCAREKSALAATLGRAGGGETPVEVTISAIGEGADARLLAVFRDVSTRNAVDRDHESSMQDARQRVEQAERAAAMFELQVRALEEEVRHVSELSDRKDHFLSSVSHELRTPLASIRSFAEILTHHGESDPAVRREFLGIIQKETERLTRLVNNTLDLARIEAGAAKLLLSDFDARAVVADAVASMQGFAADRDIRIVAAPRDAEAPLRADRDRVHQVLTNLIANAVKFSPEGATVDVTIEPGEPAGRVRLVVRDHGRGIAAEQIERIFDRFHRCAEEPGSAGTGLGLAISREIVVLHGGRIWATSAPGEGTVLRAEFPSPEEVRARPSRNGSVTGPVTGPLLRPTTAPVAAARTVR